MGNRPGAALGTCPGAADRKSRVAHLSPRRPEFTESHPFPTALSRLISKTPSRRNDRASRCGALVFDHSPGRFVTRRRHPRAVKASRSRGGQLRAGSLISRNGALFRRALMATPKLR